MHLLALLACETSTAIGFDGPEDSATDASDADTDVDADTLTFLVEGATSGTAFAILHVFLGENEVSGGEVVIEAESGETITVEVPAPEDELVDYEQGNLRASYFLPVLFEDEDGDGAYDDGDTFLGAGPTLLFWAEGTLLDDWIAAGVREGWNAMRTDFAEVWEALPPDEIPLEVNLRPRETLTLAGTFGGAFPDAAVQLATVPGAAMNDEWVSSWLYDESYSGAAWEISFDGDPPADHFYALDEAGTIYAATEVALTYTDADADGAWSGDDALLYLACHGTMTTAAYWFDSPTELVLAVYMPLYGITAGWSVAAYEGESSAWLTESEWQSLSLDGECSF